DRWLAIGDEIFFLQRRDAIANELDQFVFFSRLRSVRHDHDHAVHRIDVDSNLSGKQENRDRIAASKNPDGISQWSVVTFPDYRPARADTQRTGLRAGI